LATSDLLFIDDDDDDDDAWNVAPATANPWKKICKT
jgi:hypothetical protein